MKKKTLDFFIFSLLILMAFNFISATSYSLEYILVPENAELNWYSASLGFGESFYKFDGNGQATATEILSQDDDAFRTKQTFETVIKDVLIDLVKSVCYLEGIELSENEIQVEFDYSRFENQEKTQARLEREVSRGITSKVEYRMKVYGETEEIAKQKMAEIKESEPKVEDVIGE